MMLLKATKQRMDIWDSEARQSTLQIVLEWGNKKGDSLQGLVNRIKAEVISYHYKGLPKIYPFSNTPVCL